MRFVIQRVQYANVSVDQNIIGQIDKGFLVLIGISSTDTVEIAEKMTRKMLGLRIFEDENGKTNLDLKTVSGGLLLISQFTLYADCKKGNRPSVHQSRCAGSGRKSVSIYYPALQTGSSGSANRRVWCRYEGRIVK